MNTTQVLASGARFIACAVLLGALIWGTTYADEVAAVGARRETGFESKRGVTPLVENPEKRGVTKPYTETPYTRAVDSQKQGDSPKQPLNQRFIQMYEAQINAR